MANPAPTSPTFQTLTSTPPHLGNTARLLASCFDPETDRGDAQVERITLKDVRTGTISPDGLVVSKFFAEAVMLFCTSRVESLGFLDTDEKIFGTRWVEPMGGTKWALALNMDTGAIVTTAPNNFMRHGLGLCAMGMAIKTSSAKFRASWVALLSEMALRHVDALDAKNIANIAGTLGEAMELADPKRTGDGWHMGEGTECGDITRSPVNDLRDHLTDVDSFLALCDTFQFTAITGGVTASMFEGPQLRVVRSLITRRKHVALLGPPGVGKTVCAFESLLLEQYPTMGEDFEGFTGHDEVKSADLYGQWQPTSEPGKYVWVDGPLVRAMTARDGQGMPLLIEEFTRMPRRAQNAIITVLSDGYLVLNEKGGQIVKAGPAFVVIADMNVDPTVDDLDMYGAAFASRMRKVYFDYPSKAALMAILQRRVPNAPSPARAAVVAVYDTFLQKWQAGELSQPISPRDCVYWVEEIVAEAAARQVQLTDSIVLRETATAGAHLTWMRDLVGNDTKRIKAMEQELEGIIRKLTSKKN